MFGWYTGRCRGIWGLPADRSEIINGSILNIMMYKTNKTRLRYSAKDNPIEDSYAFRRAKTTKLRKIIRACFYLHCIAAVICIALSIVLSAGFDIVKVCVCTITSVVFAFFAVGDMEHVNVISCVIDFTLAAGAFVSAALGQHKLLFVICGIIMTLLGSSMIVSGIAAKRKRALESTSPLTFRREQRTKQDSYSAYPDYDDIPDMPEDYVIETPLVSMPTPAPTTPPPPPAPPPPRPYEKMHELADNVREILCGESNKNKQ